MAKNSEATAEAMSNEYWRKEVEDTIARAQTNSSLDDLVLVRVGVELLGNGPGDDDDFNSGCEWCQPCAQSGEPNRDLANYLHDIADAIEEGRAFGWLQSECASAVLRSGQWTPRKVRP